MPSGDASRLPKGRPKGCKNKISSEVVADLFAVYKKRHRQKWLMNDASNGQKDDTALSCFKKSGNRYKIIDTSGFQRRRRDIFVVLYRDNSKAS